MVEQAQVEDCKQVFDQRKTNKERITLIFTCDECRLIAKVVNNLKSHIVTVHDGGQWFECDQFGLSLTQPKSPDRHITNVHIESLSFRCMRCGSRFKADNRLRSPFAIVHHTEILCNNVGPSTEDLADNIESNDDYLVNASGSIAEKDLTRDLQSTTGCVECDRSLNLNKCVSIQKQLALLNNM